MLSINKYSFLYSVALHKKEAPIKKILDNLNVINELQYNAFVADIINNNELKPLNNNILLFLK